MKYRASPQLALLLTGFALSSGHSEEGRLVRIFFPATQYDPAILTGGTIPANRVHTLLFLEEKCSLPIEGADQMLRAWRVAGAYQLGCWYPTLNDEYTYINNAGEVFHSAGDYWQAYPHGILHSDGSVTITEPGFDSRKFFVEATQRITLSHLYNAFQKQAP